MEACADNVETFAAGGVLFQVYFCIHSQMPDDSMLTGDLDRLYRYCIAAAGLDWRYNIAPIPVTLLVYSCNTVYSKTLKNLSEEQTDQAR